MKTHQIMHIPFDLGTFPIDHKTGYGRLQDFFALGNEYRRRSGKPPMDFRHWVNRTDVKEYIQYLEAQGRTPLRRVKGRRGGTWACLEILISAAMDMSPEFKDEVIQKFITGQALRLRDEGGDGFLELNTTLELAAESVLGKPAHKGHYITIARIIKKRCGVDSWNACDPQALAKRVQIEDRLATMLRTGVVRDWDHLKELAETV